jgi:hypothetical protein
MPDAQLQRSLAIHCIEGLPQSLQQSIIGSREFQTRYDVTTESTVSVGDGSAGFKRSSFYDAIRRLYEKPGSSSELTSGEGSVYSATLEERSGERVVQLSVGEQKIWLPAFWFLSPHASDRLSGFDAEANKRHLTDPVILEWRERLAKASLDDYEVYELHQELRLNPGEIAEAISGELASGTSSVSTLVPPKAIYYERLVGAQNGAVDLPTFVSRSAQARLRDLLDWKFGEGLRLALLMCPHSSLSAAIEVGQEDETAVTDVFSWLEARGDRFSQVAGIELGLRILDRFPAIEAILQRMVATLLEDDPDDAAGRLSLSASLAIFTDGELARLGILRRSPPYYRRLAAIAQASIIERELVAANVASSDFVDWALHRGGHSFFLQTLIDLRVEPRWLPDFLSPKQLKLEFLGRVYGAAANYGDAVTSAEFRELLTSDGPSAIRSQMVFPFAGLPGPLEGGQVSPLAPPDEFEKLSDSLKSAEITEQALAPFVNLALIYRFEQVHAKTIAAALKATKYQVSVRADSDLIFSLLAGLATIAAATRSKELADEVRILARVMRRRQGVSLQADSLMRIGLIAAAAESDLARWGDTVGQWLTEVSLEDMDRQTAAAMQSHVRRLCDLEPTLWQGCAKADAAFALVVGMTA